MAQSVSYADRHGTGLGLRSRYSCAKVSRMHRLIMLLLFASLVTAHAEVVKIYDIADLIGTRGHVTRTTRTLSGTYFGNVATPSPSPKDVADFLADACDPAIIAQVKSHMVNANGTLFVAARPAIHDYLASRFSELRAQRNTQIHVDIRRVSCPLDVWNRRYGALDIRWSEGDTPTAVISGEVRELFEAAIYTDQDIQVSVCPSITARDNRRTSFHYHDPRSSLMRNSVRPDNDEPAPAKVDLGKPLTLTLSVHGRIVAGGGVMLDMEYRTSLTESSIASETQVGSDTISQEEPGIQRDQAGFTGLMASNELGVVWRGIQHSPDTKKGVVEMLLIEARISGSSTDSDPTAE